MRNKSGFVCEDERRKNVRKPRSGFTQDVFSAEVWLASAPLHETGKTTKSWGHAKNRDWQRATQLHLRQSLFQSQRVSPDFYFFQVSFRSHLNQPSPCAEVISKRRSAVFWVHSTGSPHRQMQDFERWEWRLHVIGYGMEALFCR